MSVLVTPEPGQAAAEGLSAQQQRTKRLVDIVLSVFGLTATAPVLVPAVLAATFDTGEWGIFSQERIGRDGVPFRCHKVRTMRTSAVHMTTVTATGDPRITRLGAVLRKLKIDELPQLVNVLRGEMSVVGPRPDVAGWADRLEGEARLVLSVRPGITSPSSLAFRHEEELLARAEDPEVYNREVVWPEKVRLNVEYVRTWSLASDLRCIVATALSVFDRG